jgi:hypothetical protein
LGVTVNAAPGVIGGITIDVVVVLFTGIVVPEVGTEIVTGGAVVDVSGWVVEVVVVGGGHGDHTPVAVTVPAPAELELLPSPGWSRPAGCGAFQLKTALKTPWPSAGMRIRFWASVPPTS